MYGPLASALSFIVHCGNKNQTEDNNVRYEDDFAKEDDTNDKSTHDEEDVNDEIKISERPSTTFYDTESSRNENQTEGNNVRYEDDFAKEDDEKGRKTSSEGEEK